MTEGQSIWREVLDTTRKLMLSGWMEEAARIRAVGLVEEHRASRKNLRELIEVELGRKAA